MIAYKDKKEISSQEQAKLYQCKNDFMRLKNEMKRLEEDKKAFNKDLGLPGEGTVVASKKIYPKVAITIKGVQMIFRESTSGGTYYFQDQEIKQKN